MAWWLSFKQRVRAVLHRREMELEMEEELQYHIDQAIERNLARGMDRAEARRSALQDFGGVERRKEQMRDERGMRPLLDFSQNLKYAFRHLRSSPGFTAVAVIVMGLGIGATTAIFSIVNSLLIKPIECENPEQVIRIYTNDIEKGRPGWNSYPDFLDFKKEITVFSAVAATSDIFPFSIVTENGAETVLSDIFSSDLFKIIGVTPLLGRTFLPEEDLPGVSEPVVIVSYSAWQKRHNSDPDIVGKIIRINGYPVTVAGVGPPGFKGFYKAIVTEYWVPWGTAALINNPYTHLNDRDVHECNVVARLNPGVSIEQARSAMNILAAGLAEKYPATNSEMSMTVLNFNEVQMDPTFDIILLPLSGFLLIVVFLVLLVACSNLAGFLLMRAISRRQEINVRIALGAGRGRLIMELLTENVLLAVMGGLLGLIATFLIVGAASSYKLPLPFALSMDIGIDSTVFLFAIMLSVATGLLIGLIPAIQSSKPDIIEALKDNDPSATTGRQRFILRNILIMAQVAVSVVLLIGAVLFIRSLEYRRNIDMGFDHEKLAISVVDVALGGYSDEESARVFLEGYRGKMLMHPEIERIALTNRIPFGLFNAGSRAQLRLPGTVEVNEGEEIPKTHYSAVSPEYFATMGIPFLYGETFLQPIPSTQSDDIIISKELAEHFWRDRNAIGQPLLLEIDDEERLVEVIGVVANSKMTELEDEPEPFLYLPFGERYAMTSILVARTTGNPAGLPGLFRRELKSLDSSVPVFDARTMSEHLDVVFFLFRNAALYLSVFGFLAMILASIGLYGTVAFSVTLRTKEIGIRMALGADKSQVIRMVLRQSLRLVASGIVIGVVLSGLVMQVLSRVLMGVSPIDPIAFVSVVIVLGTVTVIASFVPALRAAGMNPMSTLKYE